MTGPSVLSWSLSPVLWSAHDEQCSGKVPRRSDLKLPTVEFPNTSTVTQGELCGRLRSVGLHLFPLTQSQSILANV